MLFLRLLAWCFLPIPFCMGLVIGGVLLRLLTRWQRLGKCLVGLGVVLLLLMSTGPVSTFLLDPLESAHPPLLNPPLGGDPVRWVVVLGAGYNPDLAMPATTRLTPIMIRLAEGVRVYRMIPGTKLLVLIGGADENDGRVETLREMAKDFAIPESDLVVDATGRDTAEEADAIRRTVGNARFVLVTAAFHMPRAVRLCNDRGLDPIPAPTDHATSKREYATLQALPSADNLCRTQTAISERLAQIWRWLKR
jgi:uncharacterized SAM-binding protein YcdF (DUF218 family)